ncbi:hypothetical protein K501DRAFT_182859 [Backusella circina FSU 941]|nr:hypothetical protein K501DRAFT_182859 [Backusella circina FSU 941]
MPPLSSFANVLSAKALVGKQLAPISSSVIRQQTFSTNNQRSTVRPTREVITEHSILNSFPRPNLKTTLHSSALSLQMLKMTNPIQTCTNCSGPHSTEFCPC